MAIKLVVFDMAGTTVRDQNYVALALQKALNNHGFEISLEQINPLMGYEKPLAIRMLLQKTEPKVETISEELVEAIHTDFVAEMLNFYQTSQEIAPLPHVEETFDTLRSLGIKIGLNTGFSRSIAQTIVDRLEWSDKIDGLVASDEVSQGRPYPYMIQKLMTQMQINDVRQVAKVGDTEVDVNEGLNAGCPYVIGVTTGAFTHDELLPYKPTHIVDDLSKIIPIVTAQD
ncbi:HAD family hydrolase [Siphonobacter sp. SORGH_AS_0500]|uniref:HAD family hydrolase n=1 Tax=Siphonobacter sp. SORGH_AS_0500 TaxID=1864824 RepID=UPI00286298F2|nr:HAD hydrolase-like protein [Siphonobacter sp. SORGH_AS_0500]MDR6197754.1 phosphonatase-like hydrolase [Siphonobacter sp. SORGH_AS_0500]